MEVIKFGWIPERKDPRDFAMSDEKIMNFYKLTALPSKVDLRLLFDAVDNQGPFGTCTANALAAIIDYLYLRMGRKPLNPSRAFNYYFGRKIIGLSTNEDTGTTIRAIVKALVQYGTVPETDFTYTKGHILTKTVPTATVQKKALNYQGLTYVLLDQPRLSGVQKVTAFKTALNNKLPIICGFIVYDNYINAAKTGEIEYPSTNNSDVGGHAVTLVGYDDNKVIGKYKGAFLFRNSWGTSWGLSGCGWIPYQYLIDGLLSDGWNLLSEEMPK